MNIYSLNLSAIIPMMVVSVYAVGATANVIAKDRSGRITFSAAATILSTTALYAILHFTVLARTPSDTHIFMVFLDPSSNEFLKEMVMNAFLYFPFGLFLPYSLDSGFPLIETRPTSRKHFSISTPAILTISVSILLSFSIEFWQYYAGTGTAQLTDIICNALGAAIGTLSFALFSRLQRTYHPNEAID